MRSPSRQIVATLLPFAMCASLGLSGCQVGRTFFRMDSNAPIPFFGMDLLPKRDKASPTDGVSRFQSAAVSGNNEQAPEQSEPIGMRELPSRSTDPQPAASRGWSRLLGRAPKTESFVLPVAMTVDGDGRNGDSRSSDAPVEQFR